MPAVAHARHWPRAAAGWMLRLVRRTTSSLLVALVLLVTGWALAAPASACSCVGEPLAAQLQRADAVFTGRLVSREVSGRSSSGDPALHVFAVESVWKGDVAEAQGVVSAASGASCGLELSGDGPFLVLATRSGGEGPLVADLCGGTTRTTPESEAQVADLTGSATPGDPRPGTAGTASPGGPHTGLLAAGAVTAALAIAAGSLAVRRLRAPR
ncbi:hypothetical protein ACI782_13745 [Geodermatophilus sp. SYSU D00703]